MIETTSTKSNPDGLYKHIERVAGRLRNSKLYPSKLTGMQSSLKKISAFLDCTEQQAWLFSLILTLNFRRNTVGIEQMADFLGCNEVKIAHFLPEIDKLAKRRLVRAEISGRKRRAMLNEINYFVTREVLDSLLCEDRSLIRTAKEMTLPEVLKEVNDLVEDRNDGKISYKELIEDTDQLLDFNKILPFTRKVKKLKLDPDEQIMLLYVCSETLEGNPEVDLNMTCERIYDEVGMRFCMRKGLVNGTYDLIKKDIIKLENGMFRSDRDILLTDNAIDHLFEMDADLLLRDDKRLNKLLHPDNIPQKDLIFHEKEAGQLAFLEESLRKEHFDSLGKRLAEKGMSKGFTSIFYGPPGTGKTESVYQLAKKTGRQVLTVDISETKSMWYGESEKRIKEIFTGYRAVCKQCKTTPILLFNEADGVLGQRKRERRSAIDQTENSMQNIILHEMEKLEGIMIATTNLAENLDPAFERRFLYKIRFEKPSPSARASIWKMKVPEISDEDALYLSVNFEFTGGQIDNIARKIVTDELLHRTEAKLETITTFCREEGLVVNRINKIGFQSHQT